MSTILAVEDFIHEHLIDHTYQDPDKSKIIRAIDQ